MTGKPAVSPISSPIRVLLVDDHRTLLEGMTALLNSQPDLRVIGTANNAADGLRVALLEQPDVALLDIDMPKVNGLELAAGLSKQNPQLKIIIFSMYANPIFVHQALQVGAKGFVLKEEPFTVVAQAVREVYAENNFYSSAIRRLAISLGEQVSGDDQRLSAREREVIALMGEGVSMGQIAQQLGISLNTVRTLWSRAQEKLELRPLPQGMVTASTDNDQDNQNRTQKRTGRDRK